MRQVVVDTETTGLRIEDGHRIIEIGCVELFERKPTGKHFHKYINPQREIDAGALAVHGISNQFLQDKPLFNDVANDFIEFIRGAELIIHNAPFDLSFLNNELALIRHTCKAVSDFCNVVDTLQLARKLHVGQRNSLDALCKRYFIDNSKREMHGALLDAHLLAQVYLAMTGGQGSFFDAISESKTAIVQDASSDAAAAIQKHHLIVLEAEEEELAAHLEYLELLKKQGKCVWQD